MKKPVLNTDQFKPILGISSGVAIIGSYGVGSSEVKVPSDAVVGDIIVLNEDGSAPDVANWGNGRLWSARHYFENIVRIQDQIIRSLQEKLCLDEDYKLEPLLEQWPFIEKWPLNESSRWVVVDKCPDTSNGPQAEESVDGSDPTS